MWVLGIILRSLNLQVSALPSEPSPLYTVPRAQIIFKRLFVEMVYNGYLISSTNIHILL